MTNEPRPVEYDDLVYTDAHIFFYDGEPFTGIAESTSANGNLSRFHFKNGKEHGDTEVYFSSGGKRLLTPYVDGVAHGQMTEWFENGLVKFQRVIEYGILLEEKQFDEASQLIRHYVRPNDDAMMRFVQSRRRKAAEQ